MNRAWTPFGILYLTRTFDWLIYTIDSAWPLWTLVLPRIFVWLLMPPCWLGVSMPECTLPRILPSSLTKTNRYWSNLLLQEVILTKWSWFAFIKFGCFTVRLPSNLVKLSFMTMQCRVKYPLVYRFMIFRTASPKGLSRLSFHIGVGCNRVFGVNRFVVTFTAAPQSIWNRIGLLMNFIINAGIHLLISSFECLYLFRGLHSSSISFLLTVPSVCRSCLHPQRTRG